MLRNPNALAYINQGLAKANLGQYQDAIADYDQTLLLQPDNAHASSSRGNAKTALGQYQKAIANLEVALELAQEAGDRTLASELERLIEKIEQR